MQKNPNNVCRYSVFNYADILGWPQSSFELFHNGAAAKSLQLCQTLCDPIDSSPPGSLDPGILQARTLEWVAISFSNAWKWSCSVMSDSSRPHGLQPTRLVRPWDLPGKSTGVGCHCLLQFHHVPPFNCVLIVERLHCGHCLCYS